VQTIGGFKIVPANREMEFDTAIFIESSSTKKVVFVQAAENFDLLLKKKTEILDLSYGLQAISSERTVPFTTIFLLL
jgi:hypothetical protein